MPYLSFIIPVYNVADHVLDAVESVARQITGEEAELICVDDGSTDGSGAIINELCRKYPCITAIHTPNRGASAARNTGLSAARGKYIGFIDADDSVSGDFLEVISTHLGGRKPDVLFFGASILSDDISEPPQELINSVSPERRSYSCYQPVILFREKGVTPFVWNCVIRKELIDRNAVTFDEELSLGEDIAFLMSIVPEAGKIELIPDKLYNYRYSRPGSAMTNLCRDENKRCRLHIDVFGSVAKRWSERGYYSGAEELFCEWGLRFVINSVLLLDKDRCVRYSGMLYEIAEKYGVPYNRCGQKIAAKYRMLGSRFWLNIFLVYRRIRGYVR